MSIFKLFFRIANKQRGAVIIWLCILVSLLAMLVMMMGGDSENFENQSADIGIILSDTSEEAKAFCDFLESRHNVTFYGKSDAERLKNILYYTVETAVIEIPADFSARLKSGESENLYTLSYIHELSGKQLVKSDADEFLKLTGVYMESGYSPLEAENCAKSDLEKGVKASIYQSLDKDVTTNNCKVFFLYVVFGITTLYIVSLSNILVTINSKEVSQRISASSVKTSARYLQIIISSAVLVLSMWLLIMLFGIILNGAVFRGFEWLYVINSLAYTLMMTALAVLISLFGFSQNVQNFIANILSLGMSFICGVFVDLEILGEGVRSIARLLPMYWYVENVHLVSDIGAANSDYYLNLSVQLLFGVFFIALSLALVAVKTNGIWPKKSVTENNS